MATQIYDTDTASKEIANTIIQQFKSLDFWALGAWD